MTLLPGDSIVGGGGGRDGWKEGETDKGKGRESCGGTDRAFIMGTRKGMKVDKGE